MSSEKLYRIQIGFQQLWESPRAAYLRQRVDSFPPRPRELFLNALTMYHACMIYSFTSMWPGQALTSGNVADEVIERHVSAILQVAEDIVQSRRFDLRFIIFPLLMAGYATARESVKRRAIELMMTMENDCVGRNATATRRILELVSEKQAQQVMAGGRMLSVDWMEVMAENGLQVVDFGM